MANSLVTTVSENIVPSSGSNTHGGKRIGAGRKAEGKGLKTYSITLHPIDAAMAKTVGGSLSRGVRLALLLLARE